MLPIEQNEDDSRRDNKRDILSSDLHAILRQILLMPISSEALIFMADNISRVNLNQF